MKYSFITVSVMLLSVSIWAQTSKPSPGKFEGIWQVTKQRSMDSSSQFQSPGSKDFKIFDANGNFRHLLYVRGKYTELSHGSIKLTSDSTYTETLRKHLAFPGVKEGKVIFKFINDDMFLMKWLVGSSSGEEVYEKVK
ncbi:MAG TPA: DUF4488 domain-containing protein [Niabella sp.]|nr:DUF4488 domain-containing protein [Niabella sp.]